MKTIKNQKGVALVLALMVILLMTVLASGLMYNIINEKSIAGNQIRDAQALTIARAGVAEATARLSMLYQAGNDTAIVPQNFSASNLTVDWRCYIFSDAPDDPDEGNLDFKKTIQPGSDLLPYTKSYDEMGDTSQILQVRYKRFDRNNNGTIDDNTEIYFYDSKNNVVTLGPVRSDDYPVFEIISTGRVGNAKKTLVSELVIPKYPIVTRSALNSEVAVRGNGNANVCGHDHLATTELELDPPNCFTTGDGSTGESCHVPRSDDAIHAPEPDYQIIEKDPFCTAAGCLPGIESNDEITDIGANKKSWGNPDYIQDSPNPVYELWQVLGLSSAAELDAFAESWSDETSPVNGWTLTDGDITKASNAVHDGVWWVKGDLHLSGTPKFRGLIYIEGDLDLTGTLWVLGGIIVKGVTETHINGTITVLYSSRTLERVAQMNIGSGMRLVSQREIDQ